MVRWFENLAALLHRGRILALFLAASPAFATNTTSISLSNFDVPSAGYITVTINYPPCSAYNGNFVTFVAPYKLGYDGIWVIQLSQYVSANTNSDIPLWVTNHSNITFYPEDMFLLRYQNLIQITPLVMWIADNTASPVTYTTCDADTYHYTLATTSTCEPITNVTARNFAINTTNLLSQGYNYQTATQFVGGLSLMNISNVSHTGTIVTNTAYTINGAATTGINKSAGVTCATNTTTLTGQGDLAGSGVGNAGWEVHKSVNNHYFLGRLDSFTVPAYSTWRPTWAAFTQLGPNDVLMHEATIQWDNTVTPNQYRIDLKPLTQEDARVDFPDAGPSTNVAMSIYLTPTGINTPGTGYITAKLGNPTTGSSGVCLVTNSSVSSVDGGITEAGTDADHLMCNFGSKYRYGGANSYGGGADGRDFAVFMRAVYPTITPTATITSTPTQTPTNNATSTPTATATATTAPNTATPTSTTTPTTAPNTSTPTSTTTPTTAPNTNTPTATATITPGGPTFTPTSTSTATGTPTATITPGGPTSTATATATNTPTVTNTSPPTSTATALPTVTASLPTSTSTPAATSTNTTAPTSTATALPTNTTTPTCGGGGTAALNIHNKERVETRIVLVGGATLCSGQAYGCLFDNDSTITDGSSGYCLMPQPAYSTTYNKWSLGSEHEVRVGYYSPPSTTLTVTQSIVFTVGVNKDFDRTGYPVVAISAPANSSNTGALYVYKGKSSGNVTTPFWTFTGASTTGGFPSAIAFGDFDGDGYGDLAIGANTEGTNGGKVFIYYGKNFTSGGSYATASANKTIDGPGSGAQFGGSLIACDVKGTGYDALVVGAPNLTSGNGAFYVFWGQSAGLLFGKLGSTYAYADQTVTGSSTENLANAMTCADFTQQGYGALAVGAKNYNNGAAGDGRVVLWLGGPGGIASGATTATSAGADASIRGKASGTSNFGTSLSWADVHYFGYPALAVGAPKCKASVRASAVDCETSGTQYGAVYSFDGSYIFLGNDQYYDDWAIGPNSSGTFGTGIAMGDYDLDGSADLAALDASVGKIYVYHGSNAGLQQPYVVTLDQTASSITYDSVTMCNANGGDGLSDIFAGASTYNNGAANDGRVQVYNGNATALSTTPSQSISNQTSAEKFGKAPIW